MYITNRSRGGGFCIGCLSISLFFFSDEVFLRYITKIIAALFCKNPGKKTSRGQLKTMFFEDTQTLPPPPLHKNLELTPKPPKRKSPSPKTSAGIYRGDGNLQRRCFCDRHQGWGNFNGPNAMGHGFFRMEKMVETKKRSNTMEIYIYSSFNFCVRLYTVNYMVFWNMMELFVVCNLLVLDSAFGKIL